MPGGAESVAASFYRVLSVTSVMAASSSEMIQKRVTIFVSKMPFFW